MSLAWAGRQGAEVMRRFSAPWLAVAVCLCAAGVAHAETRTVGTVDKVQAQVVAVQAGQTRELAATAALLFRDRCRSGRGARLQATLADGTQLTMGENATLVVDEFVYDPFQPAALSVRVPKGPFLFVGGHIEEQAGAKVDIHTPIGTLGVRGTTVWGGPIDNGYGVLVLSGEVTVSTRHGTVTLRQGQATMVFGQARPQSARAWTADRTKRAVASISFATPAGR
jgi:hypothetical protein